jgi:DNA-binding PadR family transcriptional regulator
MPDTLSPQAFHILLALADRKPVHGYAIIQEVRRRTDGEISLTASTLYAAIKRMLDAGLIAETPATGETGGAPRRCYRITNAGLRLARADAERLARLVAFARDKRLLARRA